MPARWLGLSLLRLPTICCLLHTMAGNVHTDPREGLHGIALYHMLHWDTSKHTHTCKVCMHGAIPPHEIIWDHFYSYILGKFKEWPIFIQGAVCPTVFQRIQCHISQQWHYMFDGPRFPKCLSSFTHPHVVSNLYDLLCSVEHKIYFMKCLCSFIHKMDN